MIQEIRKSLASVEVHGYSRGLLEFKHAWLEYVFEQLLCSMFLSGCCLRLLVGSKVLVGVPYLCSWWLGGLSSLSSVRGRVARDIIS